MTFGRSDIVYLELSSRIKKQVLAGDLKDRVPSEKELAQKYGVNFKTVNKAISTLVGEGILYRVRGKGAFIKKDAHRNLQSSVRTIGLAVFNLQWLNNPFYSEILAGIGEVVQKNGHNLQFLTTNKNLGEAHRNLYYMDAWQQGKFDGMIIAGEEVDENDIAKLSSKKFPFVLLGKHLPKRKINLVGIDNFKGGYDAAMHLINLDHKCIAFIPGNNYKTDKERIAGCKEAMKNAKLKLDKKYIKPGYFEEKKAYQAMQELLKLTPRPTAVIASDDIMAASAMQAVKDAGLSVPGEISVIGFNDILLASKLTPALTTLKIPLYEMGKTTTEILGKRLLDFSIPPKRVIFPPQLVIRGSTGRALNK
ncbi:MAG: GntR family transcriptional regulator [Victivallaceae bacterium]